jgi:X-Pro dipeptidyl-peptidase
VRQATVWLAQESTYPGELRTTQQTEDVFTASWSDDRAQTQAAAIADPEVAQDHRVVFLSPPRTEPVRISGQSVLTARVTTDVAGGALGAMLVDYADGQPPFTTIDYTVRDGMDWLDSETCFGLAGALDSGCLPDVTRRLLDGVTAEVVTRGAIDLGNRDSLWEKTPTVPGTPTWAKVPLWTKDYTFPAGHRIGLVLVGSYPDHESVPPTRDGIAEYTLDAAATNLSLPVVGGREALGF